MEIYYKWDFVFNLIQTIIIIWILIEIKNDYSKK